MNLNFYTRTFVRLVSFKKAFVFCLAASFFVVNNSQAQATALSFDGVDDYVSVPVKPALNISSAITIETWMKPTKDYGVQDIFCKSSDVENSGYIFPRTVNGWASIEFMLNINGFGWQILRVPYGTNKMNQWHHVAATYDGFTMKIYIDAVEAGSFAFSGSILVNSNPLTIGTQLGFDDENYGGSLDESRIWNRALSQCEIASRMNCQMTGAQTGLVAYYKFNQGLLGLPNPLETTLQDASTTGANGALVNFGLLGTGLISNWSAGTVNTSNTCGPFTPTSVTAGSSNAYVPVGGTISLTAVSSPGATYSWVGPNGFTSNQQNPTITGVSMNAAGTYTVTATLNGCSGTASTMITVAPKASGLAFDGVNDEIVVPNSAQFNSPAFSIEAWIYPIQSSTVIQNVVCKSSNTVATGYKFPKTEDGWSSFKFELSINGTWVILAAPIPGGGLNKWNHVAATFDGYYMRMYLNGIMVASQVVNGTVTMNNNILVIGNQAGRSEFYKGKLDELRIWDRAISQCEIINNMQTCELNGAGNGLANQVALGAYYRFNQGLENVPNTSLTTLADSSGHANNGVLTNFTLTGTESNWSDGKVNATCQFYILPLLSASANGSVFQTGTTAKLFATNGNNNQYTWDGPNSFATTTQNPVLNNVQLNVSGVYTVTTPYTNCVITASTRIKVTDLPQIIASGPTSICPSGSVLLSSATTGTAYQWYLNEVVINGATSLSYLATGAGNYSVVVTNGADITISAPLTVTVIPDNTAPVPSAASLPTLNLLAPATVTSIPTANDNCRGVVNGTSNISLTFTQAGNYTITWTYNDNNGNTSSQTQNVVVTRPADVTPPALAVPADINVIASAVNCGAVVNFAATATDNSGDPVTITYSQNPGTVFPVGRTIITVTAKDASNNVATGFFWVTVAPTVVAPVTGINTLCVNGTTALATASTGGVWTSDDINIATVNSTGVVRGVRSGNVNIIYTDACGSTAYLSVAVRPLPQSPNVHVDNNCGNSVLTATNTTGTLLWSTGATTASITVANNGTYSVTQTVDGCTSLPESEIAEPKALPVTPIVTVNNNCGSSTLTVSNIVGNLSWSNGSNDEPSITVSNSGTYTVTQRANGCTSLPGTGIAAPKALQATPVVTVVNNCGSTTLSTNATGSLVWSNNATTSSINVTSAGNYSVTATNAGGCSATSAVATVTVKAAQPVPAVTVVNNCGSSTLSTNATGSLVWSNGATTSSINVTSSNNYSVTATNADGCSATSAVTAVTVKAVQSVPTVTVVNNCGSTTLSTNATGSLVWSNNATTSSINVISAGSYSVTATNAGGCSATSAVATVTVKAAQPVPTVTVVNDCGSSTLSTNATGSLVWSNGATTSSINVTSSNNYSVTATNADGCSATSAVTAVTVKAVQSVPTITVVNNCGSTTLSTNATGSLVWSNNATASSINVISGGSYSVTATNAGGCSATSAVATVTVKAAQPVPTVTVVNDCGSSTLSANATGSLVWSNGATTSSINVTSSNNYSVTATNADGCSATSAVTAVTVNAYPVLAGITGNTTVTAGSATQLSNSTAGGVWSSNSANATVNASGLVTGVNTGTAIISYKLTSVAGCATTVTTTVTVNALPTCTTPVINALSNISANTTSGLCGAPVTYTTTVSGTPAPALTYTFTGATTGNGTGTGSGATFNAGVTTVVITATNSCGSVTRSFTVTVTDATAPVALTKNITVALDANGQATVTPAQVDNGSSDNCSAVTLAFKTITTSTTTTGIICATADENGNLVLTAPSGALITAINFASYGTPNGTCGSFTLGACNATGSKTVVEGYALGRNTATIPANNTVFGDPCVGTYKRLYVQATYTVTAPGTTANVSSLSFDCSKKGANTVTLNVTDANGNASTQTATVTVVDNTAPVVTAIANQTFCGTAGSYTIPALSATDNCGVTSVTYAVTGATSRTGNGYNASGTFNAGTSTITWTVKDAGNNTTTSSATVVVGAGPVATITASATTADFCSEVVLNGSSSVSSATYKWMSGSAVVGTSQQFSLGQSSAEGTYQLVVTANGCSSTPASYSFNKQSLLSSYTILAYDDVHFGRYSKVATGSIGVMTSGGNARFYSNTSVDGPGSFVKSPDIDLNGYNINIPRQIIGLASVTLPAMQYNTAYANSYSTYSTAQYTTVTLSSNYKKLTIRKGTYATLSGTIFGTIELEEGASVRFTNSTVNIEKLLVDDGAKDGYYSYVRFAPNSSIRVATQVSIGSQVLVNPDNNKVTFYMGDNKCDEERFTVKGADTKFIANIVMPNGKLMVTSTDKDDDYHESCNHQAHSYWNCRHNSSHNHKSCDHRSHSAEDCNDDVYMTGTFIVEDVESKGNTVIWNNFVCGSPAATVVMNSKPAPANTIVVSATQEKPETVTTEEELKITVMPNPSTTYFTLKFESKYETPVNMRVMDANGRVVDAQSKIGSNSTIRIGAGYASGTYYAEMIQGGTRKVVQLLKIK
jgi:hypothetical protein